MAGVVCARTLAQAGHAVDVFEAAPQPGGRTAALDSPFGSFDSGAQYFTVRDGRFQTALMQTVPDLCRRWSVSTVRMLDAAGRVTTAAPPPSEAHWVATPTMGSLVDAWAAPLAQAGQLHTDQTVVGLTRGDGLRWQVRTRSRDGSTHERGEFDAVVLALPAPQAQALLLQSQLDVAWSAALDGVDIAPCWTMMLAFAHAVQPGLTTLGPQWNAARSTHHRIAWLARESSKPARNQVERWTVQASPAWSREHLQDEPARVQGKLLKAFAEVTGIHAAPTHVQLRRWQYAQTQSSLGQTCVWDAELGLGACGDWCLGYRLEDAFVSGLELALAMA
ncbi:hypothetical protein GCM10022279_23940 [Comamonas faecalis]|uniref:Amine oxidase domain-containing protein n=2 Tax=Comamonas faecalis TaxID=1387849 RepID=A0ABP7RM04_9BURK